MAISGIIVLLIFGLQIANKSILTKPVTTQTPTIDETSAKPSMPLAFFLLMYGHYYTDNLKVFAKNLKNGDYLIIRGKPSEALAVIQKVNQSKSLFETGVHVNAAIFYYKIGDIVTGVPKLPPGIDYIVYDYEKGDNYSPEFTTNESKSIEYFDKAESAVMEYDKNTGSNARLMVTLPFGELRSSNWDWRLAAKHMDVIDMQLQAFLKNHVLMKSYISDTYEQKTKPAPLIFVQLSISRPGVTVQDNVDAINAVKDPRIDAFLIWHQSNQTLDLKKFFSMVRS